MRRLLMAGGPPTRGGAGDGGDAMSRRKGRCYLDAKEETPWTP
jgi:hypothetical protein